MTNQKTLLPPIGEISRRLTEVAREQQILRSLLRLKAREQRWEAEQAAGAPQDSQREALA